ncbi:MAG: hypothetical protein N2V74_02485 [Candidatus Methanospirare jalkutatii]|nr:MAG: hypothetical protein N2V74_02485 [Candidatus Methanospirare jalkutatii]
MAVPSAKNEAHERRSSSREIYADIRAISPLVIRADGRNFHRILRNFKKPFDRRFAESMAKATEIFFTASGFNPKFAFIFSDEVNLFFTEIPFNGRIEKLDSVVASFLASALTLTAGFKEPISFDARVIPLCKDAVFDYFAERQAEAWRNHINSYAFYTLIAEGFSERDAQERLKGMKSHQIHELLFKKGINLGKTPAWQRRGILIARVPYEKEGFNPKTGEKVVAERRKIAQFWELPLFKTAEGKKFLERFVHS